MKIIENILKNIEIDYPISNLAPLNQMLFIDIETTGLSPAHDIIYMIGAIYNKNDNFYLVQWFAESPEDEYEILKGFNLFAENFNFLVHYNGNQFDIPFIIKRSIHHNLVENLSTKNGIDLYKRILPYKKFLGLIDCKQKTIESYLNINREDIYTGRELISMYKDYMINPSENNLKKMFLHNAEDVLGLIKISPILSFCDMIYGNINITKVNANTYKDNAGILRQELMINFKFDNTLPVPLTYHYKRCYFSGRDNEAFIKIPIVQKELKYFYSDYKNYFYLPAEDVAIHKTVSSFVDSENRMRATPSTCYTRKYSDFLPQWDILVEPFFKENYRSDIFYFEITDTLKKNRDFFKEYACYIIKKMST